MNCKPLSPLADRYVQLGLHFHGHDRNPFIYFGPPEWRSAAQTTPLPLADIEAELAQLGEHIAAAPASDEQHGEHRQRLLLDRIQAMLLRAQILRGHMPTSFAQEARALYGVEHQPLGEAHYQTIADGLESAIPGQGPLNARIAAFRDQFLIPGERLESVLRATLDHARHQTRQHWRLPDGEGLELSFVTGGPFVGFADYQGQYRSRVMFNLAAPIHLDRVTELCCHEAYPGHHVQGCLIEAHVVNTLGWREYSFTPLFGSHTAMIEGAANYGIGLVFDADERQSHDREVILPLAGMTHLSDQLPTYHRLIEQLNALNHARNETAMQYLYQGTSREQAVTWLMRFGLETRAMAEQRLMAIDALRSYTVTYNLGLEWVSTRIRAQGARTREQGWAALRQMLECIDVPMTAA